jgi:hypothetical protein
MYAICLGCLQLSVQQFLLRSSSYNNKREVTFRRREREVEERRSEVVVVALGFSSRNTALWM